LPISLQRPALTDLSRPVRGQPLGEGVTLEDLAHDGDQFVAHAAGGQPCCSARAELAPLWRISRRRDIVQRRRS
jgi:hypothetical protein